MNRFLTLLVSIMVMLASTACGAQKKSQETGPGESPKCVVLYYSQEDATKAIAQQIQQALDADIEAIEVVDPYNGTYQETIERCLAEQADGAIPAIKPLETNLADYDIVFLGYPIWFGTYARPIMGLIATTDFAGKKIVPFCTFGSGGLESSAADLRDALADAEIAEGYGVRRARLDAAPEELHRFLVEQGYLEGEIAPLPQFGEEHPVTEEETAVFDAACGNYQFPLGTPVTVAEREVPAGTEYKYVADSRNPQGESVQAVIYVIAPSNGEAPQFTRVVR